MLSGGMNRDRARERTGEKGCGQTREGKRTLSHKGQESWDPERGYSMHLKRHDETTQKLMGSKYVGVHLTNERLNYCLWRGNPFQHCEKNTRIHLKPSTELHHGACEAPAGCHSPLSLVTVWPEPRSMHHNTPGWLEVTWSLLFFWKGGSPTRLIT